MSTGKKQDKKTTQKKNNVCKHTTRLFRTLFVSCWLLCLSSSISYPAEKLPPIPFIRATDELLSSSNCVNCAASSSNSASFMAFCFSGRLIDRIVTALNRSTTTNFVLCVTENHIESKHILWQRWIINMYH